MNTNTAKLSWYDNSSIETGFIIEMSRNGSYYDSVMTVGPNVNSALVNSNYDSTSKYYFRVYAQGIYNRSPLSNIVNQDIKGNFISPTGFEMIYVEGGTFLMGSPDSIGNDDEHPQHRVTLSSYYIGKYEVTVGDVNKVDEWVQQNHSWLDNVCAYCSPDSMPISRSEVVQNINIR